MRAQDFPDAVNLPLGVFAFAKRSTRGCLETIHACPWCFDVRCLRRCPGLVHFLKVVIYKQASNFAPESYRRSCLSMTNKLQGYGRLRVSKSARKKAVLSSQHASALGNAHASACPHYDLQSIRNTTVEATGSRSTIEECSLKPCSTTGTQHEKKRRV